MTGPFPRDPLPRSSASSKEVGFSTAEIYNASELLFCNLDRGFADKVAIFSDQEEVTYEQLCDRASRTGNALLSLDLKAGSRVLLMLDDTPAYPAIFFGAIRAGLVPILANTHSSKELTHFFLEDSRAKVAICDASYDWIFDDEALSTTSLETVITVRGSSGDEVLGTCWESWTEGFSNDLAASPTRFDDMAFWMYSSGSTGRPKGIVHLQHDLIYSAETFGKHVLEIRENDVCFSVPKIFFAYGLGNSISFPFSVGASTVLLSTRPTPASVFASVKKYRPTLFFGLPTLYNSLLNSEEKDEADFSSVRLCLSAAEVLSKELFDEWRDRFGHEILEGLGSTEMTHIYLSNLPHDVRCGSAGKRVPGYEIKLTDVQGTPVGPGEEGILWVRGDSSSPSYWNRPEKTQQTMRDDWIWTGDRFVVDKDGFYFFKGRTDDLIKVSGQWVYPLEVEICLSKHPAVLECAVLGTELPNRQMTLQAYVVLVDGEVGSDARTDELKTFVKNQLLPYKYPREIHYLSQLPKTGTDKIDRQALLSDRTG